MPTYTQCPPGTAHGAKGRQSSHAMPWSAAEPLNENYRKARSLVRWSKTVGEVRLIKVGPRQPKLADKLQGLAARFNKE